ncbi:hypothetical protein CRYUN_Cryun19dG0018100 [Craigia yunnanensis]
MNAIASRFDFKEIQDKVFQVRVGLLKDLQKQQAMWERQHELAADKIYAMCSELGGFFLKIAQIILKPDLAPAAWVKKLVTLYDQAPATPFDAVLLVLEKELGRRIGEIFEKFDVNPLGSASIAQVHRARIRGDKNDIVVKVIPIEDDFKALHVLEILTIKFMAGATSWSPRSDDDRHPHLHCTCKRQISNLICILLPRKWKNRCLYSH